MSMKGMGMTFDPPLLPTRIFSEKNTRAQLKIFQDPCIDKYIDNIDISRYGFTCQ